MRFKSLPVTSLEDATVDFEQLQTKDILNLTAESVLQLLSTSAKVQIAYGTGSAAFTLGNIQSAQVTVPHGLARTPGFVVAFVNVQTSTNTLVLMQTWKAADATNLYLYGQFSPAPGGSFSEPFYWVAIG